MLEEKGWLMVTPGGPPNFWGCTIGIQRVIRITPEGKLDAPSDDTNYNPTKKVPANWLDTNWRNPKEREEDKKIWTRIKYGHGGAVP